MSNYCVSFRVGDQTVGGQTYTDRYNRLIDNAFDGSQGYWDETTAFLLVGSSLSTPDFAKKVCAGLSLQHDMVFIFDPSDMSANYFGPFEHAEALVSFFPRAKKL